jgi:hypothetical protein
MMLSYSSGQTIDESKFQYRDVRLYWQNIGQISDIWFCVSSHSAKHCGILRLIHVGTLIRLELYIFMSVRIYRF